MASPIVLKSFDRLPAGERSYWYREAVNKTVYALKLDPGERSPSLEPVMSEQQSLAELLYQGMCSEADSLVLSMVAILNRAAKTDSTEVAWGPARTTPRFKRDYYFDNPYRRRDDRCIAESGYACVCEDCSLEWL